MSKIEDSIEDAKEYFDKFYGSPDKRILLIEQDSWKPKFAKEKILKKLKSRKTYKISKLIKE